MDLILSITGTSFLATAFIIIMFVAGLPMAMIFKNVGNEKIMFTVGAVVAILVCQTTITSYTELFGEHKIIVAIGLAFFFIILSVPFVAYGFPDVIFPGRALIAGGAVSSIAAFAGIKTIDFDLSSLFSNNLVLYASAAWALWNMVAFINNPSRRNRVFNNIVKGKTEDYVEGDFR